MKKVKNFNLMFWKNCDRIIVLNKGKIEESGKYNELIEEEGIFKDMYYGKLK